jgi:hypothetical protein
MTITAWLARAITAMLTISALATLILGAANYAACRADGTDKVACVVTAVIMSVLQALAFAFLTVVNLITALFP